MLTLLISFWEFLAVKVLFVSIRHLIKSMNLDNFVFIIKSQILNFTINKAFQI